VPPVFALTAVPRRPWGVERIFARGIDDQELSSAFRPFRWKFESSAGNSKNPQNFQISCRFFIFPAEDLVFSLEILFSSRFLDFPAEF
jgi:hypothetical protein